MSPHEPDKVEHIEDFTAHEWCNALLSDPSVTLISNRQISDRREGISNTFFTRTLFTDNALRAFLSLYKPGRGHRRAPGADFITGSPHAAICQPPVPSNAEAEAQRQAAKPDKTYDVDDPDAPENLILISLGGDTDGGTNRLHGGVTATLLDQVMGTLVSNVYQYRCATSDLHVKYKQAVNTPCILLCRAKLVKEKGRWIETKAWVEDGKGTVLAEGSGAFVMMKVSSGGPKI